MGIKQRKAFAVQGVLACQVCNQSRFAGARLADDVQVRPAVSALDAKTTPLRAEVSLGKEGDLIVLLGLHSLRLATQQERGRRAKWPGWMAGLNLILGGGLTVDKILDFCSGREQAPPHRLVQVPAQKPAHEHF